MIKTAYFYTKINQIYKKKNMNISYKIITILNIKKLMLIKKMVDMHRQK